MLAVLKSKFNLLDVCMSIPFSCRDLNLCSRNTLRDSKKVEGYMNRGKLYIVYACMSVILCYYIILPLLWKQV